MEFLLEVLAAFTPITAQELKDELKKHLKEDGTYNQAEVQKIIKTRIGEGRKDFGEAQRARYFKEGKESIEKLVIAEAGISSTAIGQELITQAFTAVKEKNQPKETSKKLEITKELLEKSPIAKDWMADKNQALIAKHTAELEEKDKSIKANRDESNQSLLRTKAIEFYLGKKANILLTEGDGAGKIDPTRQTVINTMLNSKNWDFKENDNGETMIIPLGADGQPKRDKDTMVPITFEEELMSPGLMPFGYGKEPAKVGGFKPGIKKPGESQVQKRTPEQIAESKKSLEEFKVKDFDDVQKYMSDPANSSEDKKAVMSLYRASKEQKKEEVTN